VREVNFNISRFRLRNTGIRAVHPPECRERGGNNEQNPYNRDEALTCVPADPFGERGVFLPCRATTSFSFSDGRVLLLDRLGHCAWQVVNCCRLTSGRRTHPRHPSAAPFITEDRPIKSGPNDKEDHPHNMQKRALAGWDGAGVLRPESDEFDPAGIGDARVIVRSQRRPELVGRTALEGRHVIGDVCEADTVYGFDCARQGLVALAELEQQGRFANAEPLPEAGGRGLDAIKNRLPVSGIETQKARRSRVGELICVGQQVPGDNRFGPVLPRTITRQSGCWSTRTCRTARMARGRRGLGSRPQPFPRLAQTLRSRQRRGQRLPRTGHRPAPAKKNPAGLHATTSPAGAGRRNGSRAAGLVAGGPGSVAWVTFSGPERAGAWPARPAGP